MRKNHLALLLLLFVAAFCWAWPARPAGSQDAADATTWEHLALTHELDGGQDVSGSIVNLGRQGWELADVEGIIKEGSTVKTVYYFKRRR